jgi:hypothetical protein
LAEDRAALLTQTPHSPGAEGPSSADLKP